MTEMVSRALRGMPTPTLTSQSTSRSEKLSAANALPRKPDRVIATCIVARNFAGSLIRRLSLPARLSPWALSLESFASFMDKSAISALANTAFSAINATWISSNSPMESFI